MTLEAIRTTEDANVERAIFESVQQVLGVQAQEHYALVKAMPIGFQVVFSTLALEGEVGNGGFLQYFYNPSGDYAELGLEALRILGAEEHAAVLQDAMSRLEEEVPVLEPYWRQGTIAAFFDSYKVSRLGELDKRWYSLSGLSSRRLAYIRNRVHDFE